VVGGVGGGGGVLGGGHAAVGKEAREVRWGQASAAAVAIAAA